MPIAHSSARSPLLKAIIEIILTLSVGEGQRRARAAEVESGGRVPAYIGIKRVEAGGARREVDVVR